MLLVLFTRRLWSVREFDGGDIGVLGRIATVKTFHIFFDVLGDVVKAGFFGIENGISFCDFNVEFAGSFVDGLGGAYQRFFIGEEIWQFQIVFIWSIVWNGCQQAEKNAKVFGLLGVGLAGSGNSASITFWWIWCSGFVGAALNGSVERFCLVE